MEGDLSEVGYPPRPLPFPIMTVDVDVDCACEVWRTGKIFRLEEFVSSVVETTLLKQDILYALIAPANEEKTNTEDGTATTPEEGRVDVEYHDPPSVADASAAVTSDSNSNSDNIVAALEKGVGSLTIGATSAETKSSTSDATSSGAASISAAPSGAESISHAAMPSGAEPASHDATSSTNPVSFSTPPATAAAIVDSMSSSAADYFPDPTRKLMKLISLQLECSKLQSTLLSMGESIGDPQVSQMIKE